MDVLEAEAYIFCSQSVKHKSFGNSTSPLQCVIEPAINFSSIAILGAIQISLRRSLNKKANCLFKHYNGSEPIAPSHVSEFWLKTDKCTL